MKLDADHGTTPLHCEGAPTCRTMETGMKSVPGSPASSCARTPVTSQCPIVVPLCIRCTAVAPCCQFSATSSDVLCGQGLRYRTSKCVESVNPDPKNVTVNESPTRTISGSNRRLQTFASVGRLGSNSSAMLTVFRTSSSAYPWIPPATRTLPLESTVNVCDTRLTFRELVASQVPVA